MAAVDYHDVYNWHPGDSPESEGAACREAGEAVVRALHGLHERAAEMAASKHVTQEGATKLLDPLQKKVIEEAAQHRRTLNAAAVELAADERSLFSVPALEPGDLDGATKDAEARRWYDGLEGPTRTEFEAQAMAGQHPAIVLALARSPVPGRAKTFGASVYRAEVEKTKAGRVSALDRRRRGLAWLEGVLDRAPKAAAMDISSRRPVETSIEKLSRARLSMKTHHAA